MPAKLFTLEEAEALLPFLAPTLYQLQHVKREHDEVLVKLSTLGARMKSNGHGIDGELALARQEAGRTSTQVNALIEKVQEMGCELKDPDNGLVDFRAEREGREVYLCWKLGEEHVSHWHELDTGFAGRQPLETIE
jgi:hypothetical protein